MCTCKEGYFTPKMVPCPDGKVGCLVAHYDDSSYICSECGTDWRRKPGDPSPVYREEIGLGIINLKAASKLKLDP